MKNFKDLKIWQKGFQIATNSFRIIETFPTHEKYGLALQITKSGISIPSNIAEGSRSSDKDYKRFIEISLGSAFELETQLLVAREIKYGNLSLIQITLELLAEEEKMLSAFSKSLLKNNFAGQEPKANS
jgi:four helix bundle protein